MNKRIEEKKQVKSNNQTKKKLIIQNKYPK